MSYSEVAAAFDALPLDDLLVRGTYPAVHGTDVAPADWHPSDVANDLGAAQTTARDWLGILEATYVSFRPAPYHTTFGKRLVKTPKFYFHDTGTADTPYFWRDNIGNEMNLRIESAGCLQPVEFKSGATFQTDWLRGLHTWQRHAAQARQSEALLVCAAPGNQRIQGVGVAHWRDALQMLSRVPARIVN